MTRKSIISIERVHHVHNHLTPLAVILIVPGLFVAELSRQHVAFVAGLLCLSLLINSWSAMRAGRSAKSHAIGKARVISNYAINILLLWLLYKPWPSVWLLLLLTASGAAVYQQRWRARNSALGCSALLATVHAVYGAPGVQGWVETVVRIGVIIAFTLFINGIKDLPSPKS
jgi:hypothetical protein